MNILNSHELVGSAIAQHGAKVIWGLNLSKELVAVTVYANAYPDKGFTQPVEADNDHFRLAALAKALGDMVFFLEAETKVDQV